MTVHTLAAALLMTSCDRGTGRPSQLFPVSNIIFLQVWSNPPVEARSLHLQGCVAADQALNGFVGKG
eukprot:7149206-Ditylum_brightwellii.AAC.1